MGAVLALQRGSPPGTRILPMAMAENTNDSEFMHEGRAVAQEGGAIAGQQGAGGERGPLRGLGQGVGGVQFFGSGDRGQDGGAPGGEKRRREHQPRR